MELGGGRSSGLVVNGCDWALLNRAQPLDISTAALNTASAQRTDRRIRMTDRLREFGIAAATYHRGRDA
ncbi:hypothetical protein [Mycobacterium kubicae]|uniref:hypothetical protein n=1 Tax=Mycobacterium kubicae TaxID=120959 RepID=UPI0021B1A75C|nr:hypothetical protein [Mycobacterium kubicae]